MKAILAMAVLAVLLTSCGSYSGISSSPKYFDKKNFAADEKRMMIFNASLKLSVKNADSLNSELNRLTSRLEGYSVILGYSRSTIRIPASRLNDAINEISKLGKMSEKRLVGSDVTDEFNDYEVRLENATKARQRYLELLAKAENVQAGLMVEKELERLNGEIEMLKGKKELLNHLSEFSTIDIDIHPREKPGVIGYVALYAYKGVKWLFVRG